MMHWIKSAGLAVAALVTLSSCDRGAPAIAYDWPAPSPPFYEISNANGEVEGWMLGTIHALPDGVNWRTPAIDQAARSADALWVEIAQLGDSGAIASTFSDLAATPDLGPLKARIDPALHAPLGEMLERSDYSAGDFDDIESWAAALMLASVDAPSDPRNGVDRAIIAQFKERGDAGALAGGIEGFETAAGQLGIFDQLAAPDQRALLEGTIRAWDEQRGDRLRLVRTWLVGDIAALEATTTQGFMADPDIYEALLVARNEAWIAPIITALEGEPRPLVAVGAAHLVGPDGIAAMLEERGYQVRRVE
ncbi:MAG: TraB/GumN family protein [Pseudomonadota bacterium]